LAGVRTSCCHRHLEPLRSKVGEQSTSYTTTLFVKLILVAVSGIGAAGHIFFARRRPALGGILAALALLAALGATFVGVLLATG